jgi:hypothetical protein
MTHFFDIALKKWDTCMDDAVSSLLNAECRGYLPLYFALDSYDRMFPNQDTLRQRTGTIIRIANPLMEDDEVENDTPWITAASSGKMDAQIKLPAAIRAVYSQML